MSRGKRITVNRDPKEKSLASRLWEACLFLLLLRARLIYVTSQAVHLDVVDYYLDLLPGVISVHAKKRLFLFCASIVRYCGNPQGMKFKNIDASPAIVPSPRLKPEYRCSSSRCCRCRSEETIS